MALNLHNNGAQARSEDPQLSWPGWSKSQPQDLPPCDSERAVRALSLLIVSKVSRQKGAQHAVDKSVDHFYMAHTQGVLRCNTEMQLQDSQKI